MMTPTRTTSVAELVDGRKIVLTQLTQRDYFSMLKQARKAFFQSMVECIPDTLPEEDKDKLRSMAYKDMKEMSVDDEYIWRDLDNLVFIFWLALKPEQPTMTLDDVGEIVDQPGNLERILGALNDVKAQETVGPYEKKT